CVPGAQVASPAAVRGLSTSTLVVEVTVCFPASCPSAGAAMAAPTIRQVAPTKRPPDFINPSPLLLSWGTARKRAIAEDLLCARRNLLSSWESIHGPVRQRGQVMGR